MKRDNPQLKTIARAATRPCPEIVPALVAMAIKDRNPRVCIPRSAQQHDF